MNFETSTAGALRNALAGMPTDAKIYIVLPDGRRVPLLSVHTLHEANEVWLGSASPVRSLRAVVD